MGLRIARPKLGEAPTGVMRENVIREYLTHYFITFYDVEWDAARCADSFRMEDQFSIADDDAIAIFKGFGGDALTIDISAVGAVLVLQEASSLADADDGMAPRDGGIGELNVRGAASPQYQAVEHADDGTARGPAYHLQPGMDGSG